MLKDNVSDLRRKCRDIKWATSQRHISCSCVYSLQRLLSYSTRMQCCKGKII